jgi:hypothetical protein
MRQGALRRPAKLDADKPYDFPMVPGVLGAEGSIPPANRRPAANRPVGGPWPRGHLPWIPTGLWVSRWVKLPSRICPPLCGAAFAQIAADRQGRSKAF